MKSLSTKLSLALLASLMVGSVLTGILVVKSQKAILTRQLDDDGKTLAKTIANMSIEAVLSEDVSLLRGQVEATGLGNRQIVFIRVFDDARKLTVAYPASAEKELPANGFNIYESPVAIAADGLPPEVRGRVEVGLDNGRYAEVISSSIGRMVTGTLVSFSILAAVLWLALRANVIRPLGDLDRHVAVIAGGDLSQPIAMARKDEIGRLGSALEAMRVNLRESYARIQEQVEALKELDRMKDEFLANTSHELKTPLNGIIGLAESILLGSYGDVPKEQQEPVELVLSCANRLWKMTDSILKFSKLHQEAAEDQSPLEPQRLADHLEEALADLRASAEKAGVRILLSVPKDFEALYRRDDLEQVLRIFVDNAVKYASGGVVQVLARKWEDGPQRGFQVAVRDNGPGIPKDLHGKIFEPFVQGISHETRPQGGVGLGLAIASKLVVRMGAQIHLESEPGKGAAFTVLVPEGSRVVEDLRTLYVPWPSLKDSIRIAVNKARQEEPVVSLPPRRPEAQGALEKSPPAHVLVVDDEAVNREVAWQALRDEYQVTRASDGSSALEVLRSTPVDLVLLDIMMPGMSGYDVLQAMRKERILDRVPVIVLSAKASREAVVKGLELGASDYLGKPFHRAELLCRLRVHLELKRQRDQLQAEVAAKTNALQLAEHASRVKTQFLSNMSHEIRTPLNGILGFLELAREADPTPEQTEYLQIMEERTHALLGIVNDILDITKIESRQVEMDASPVVPAEVVGSLATGWASEAARKGLRFECSCDRASHDRVWTDRRKLEQILRNLVSNALKFTPQGSVTVRASLEAAGAAGEPGEAVLRIQVADTGIGIPGSKQAEVFEPFTQVDGSATRNYGGTGLGLSISRSLARTLGGDIAVESEPDRGSTFTCTLRVRRSAAPEAALAARA
ncbi:MAG: response regulator [Planctomycetes bacterium]|nr:response regulator [Planctomycetota bacterium]